MKLLEISSQGSVFNGLSSPGLYTTDGKGFVIGLEEGRARVSLDGEFLLYETVFSSFGLVEILCRPSWGKGLNEEKIQFRCMGGDVALSEGDKKSLLYVASGGGDKGCIRRKLSDGKRHLLIYTKEDGCIKDYPDAPVLAGGEFYEGTYYVAKNYKGTPSLVAFKDSLETEMWIVTSGRKEFSGGGDAINLFRHKANIISVLGYDRDPDTDRAINGTIFAVDASAGKKQWELVYEEAFSNIFLIDNSRFIAQVKNAIVVISPETGDILQVVDVNFPVKRESGERISLITTMWLIKEYIFFIAHGERSDKLNMLKIFDANTLELVREECFDDKGVRLLDVGRSAYRLVGDYLFLPASRKEYGRYLKNLLMIDLNDIQAPFEFEESPEFSVQLPEEDDESLRISVEDACWEDVVRFGERKIITNLVKVGRGGCDEVGNPFFNGQVKFIISNSTSPQSILKEKLGLLKMRLEHYIEEKEDGFDYLHDEPISLEFIVE